MEKMVDTNAYVDIVFCLDMTGDCTGAEQLRYGLADFAKNYKAKYLENRGGEVKKLRVRFVLFKDYTCDCDPMIESEFFTLDEDLDEALAFLEGRYSHGGGDMPECSLEALTFAMRSEWTAESGIKRHIICLVTDANAKSLTACRDCAGYPEDMPESLDEIKQMWDGMDKRAKRLVLFAPDWEPWGELTIEWEQTFLRPVSPGCGCGDVDIVKEFTDIASCI